jgi:hypothetical protein
MARFMIEASNGLRNNSGNTVMMSMRIGLFSGRKDIIIPYSYINDFKAVSRFSFYHFRPTQPQKDTIKNAENSLNTHKVNVR